MTRTTLRLIALAGLVALSGCATLNGIGQDVETTGRVIQRSF